jgi:hypothetical protein
MKGSDFYEFRSEAFMCRGIVSCDYIQKSFFKEFFNFNKYEKINRAEGRRDEVGGAKDIVGRSGVKEKMGWSLDLEGIDPRWERCPYGLGEV